MYQKHKIETVFFEQTDVFGIGLASGADEEGGGSSQHSYGGDSPSDM